jgi:hypothetical protein
LLNVVEHRDLIMRNIQNSFNKFRSVLAKKLKFAASPVSVDELRFGEVAEVTVHGLATGSFFPHHHLWRPVSPRTTPGQLSGTLCRSPFLER